MRDNNMYQTAKSIAICLLSLLVLLGCNSPECNCPMDENTRAQNKDFITNLKNAWKDGDNHYWPILDEPFLFDLNGKAFRFREEDWMAGINRLYRLSKVDSEYMLIYKEFEDGENINEYGTYTSLKTIRKIPVETDWVHKIDSLHTISCIWTQTIDTSKIKSRLHPKAKILEIYNPNRNPCTKMDYQIVSLFINPSPKFDLIVEEYEQKVRNYVNR